ncbi:MAG: hypothetical protein AAGK22_12860, partial [Acidobacteriota bacterium]
MTSQTEVAVQAGVASQPEAVVAADALNVRLRELYVRVDVEGAPLEGLGRDDFELRIDGEPVRVLAVTDRSAAELPPTEGHAAREAARRQVVVVLDRRFTETVFVDRAREKSVELFEELTPARLEKGRSEGQLEFVVDMDLPEGRWNVAVGVR